MAKRLLALLLLVGLGGALPTSAEVLFNLGAPDWRWRPGTNEASTPITAWRTNGFNDSQFVTAPAPFWHGDVRTGGTQITNMQNVYLCLFLRKNFNVTGASALAGLRLNYFIDDGLVVWVNGTEVFRENVTDVVLTTNTLAVNQAIDPAPLVTTPVIPIAPGVLLEGANTIAVQVFQSTLNSSDLGFDLSLESIANETTPPTVQSVEPAANSTLGALAGLTVTFSEPVSGVEAADLLVNGTPATTVSPVSSSVYLFNFPQPAYGTVQLTWAAGHGITDQAVIPNAFNATGPGATWQYTLVDQVAPIMASLAPGTNETVRALTDVTVVFSEAVTGVDAADLRINNVPASGLSGGGDLYTFSFPQPATGVVQAAWAPGHGIADLAAVPNAFAGGSWTYILDPNALVSGGPVISEFMAVNSGAGAYLDENGDSSDWIEIQNTGNLSVSLQDWALTDDSGNLFKWRFPATNLQAGAFLVVFASEKDRRVPGARLHTNFKLESNGEYLALIRPDGSTASDFFPAYPPQRAGVSYGLGVLSSNSTLVRTNAPARVQIPASGAEGTNWLYVGYNDAGWIQGTNGVGYGTTNVTQADYGAVVLGTGPLVYYRLGELSGTTAANVGSMGAAGNGTYTLNPTLGVNGPRPPALNGFESDNRAINLSGTAGTDYVAGPGGLLNGRAAFTIAGWIRPTAAQAARTGLFGQNDCVEFGFISAGILYAWTPSGNIGSLAYPFPNNEWHHIALVGVNNQLLLYLDGTQRASSAGAAASSASSFNVGGGILDATGNDFVGDIDEVAMWDRGLSAAEVLGLYSAGTNAVGVPAIRYAATDVGPVMSNVNASAYIRLPFTIDNPANIQLATLRARYDDGFVAYVNGIEVARANAPGALVYNAAAAGSHTPAPVDQFQFSGTVLRAGGNVLAIQALNAAAADDDFLFAAELIATHVAAASSGGVFITSPSPGSANAGGTPVLGPSITEVAHAPNVPTDVQDITVTARVTPTFAPIGNVAVRYQVMFGTVNELPMFDDGLHGDGVASDGIYGATLPIAAVSTNGQMIRWYFRATDSFNNVSRWPLFLAPTETEYLGTVVNPAYVTSQLPIFHLFAPTNILQPNPPTSQIGADSEAGARVSLFYDGEFYDNIHMELRGNTSATQNKKAHRLEFNRDHEFRHPGPGGRIRKTSLLSEPTDSSYLHQHLSFWFMNLIGVPSPFDYPVRLQLNGVFYQLAFHNDVLGEEQMARMGYDPAGALYKAVGNVKPDYASTGGFVKLEPDDVVSRADYDQLARGINETNTFANRKAVTFDLLDLPEVINYLAGARWCSENDDVWSNMCLYRDTFGDQLWRCIPFDMSASWGQRYGGNNPLEASIDTRKSHPLYGGRAIDPGEGPGPPNRYNRLYDVIISVPETREMLLRRMRTIMDRWIQPPGTPANQLIIENYIKQMTNLIAPEALLDRAKWGPTAWAPVDSFIIAASNLMSQFVGPRRTHWYVTHCITNNALVTGTNATQKAGIPLEQPAAPVLGLGAVEFNPASGNQAQEYICLTNPNPYAVDISGWGLSGGVDFTFKPGTVMPSNSVLYVSPNVLAFKQRSIGASGGQGLFVVGPYQGQLSARGESLVLRDTTGFQVFSNTYPGAPSPAQQYLRVTEIMYNPAPLAGSPGPAEDAEFIELMNIGPAPLDLTGVRFSEGVNFRFLAGPRSNLGPGQRLVVVRNAAAFTARHGGGLPVAGEYAGSLANEGERLRLEDAGGDEILEFRYDSAWYPITDGVGCSLVILDAGADPAMWGWKESWRPNGLEVNPGLPDVPASALRLEVLVNEVLSHAEAPNLDAFELWNSGTTAVDIGGWFLSDDLHEPKKFRFPPGTFVPAGGFLALDEMAFNSWNDPPLPGSFSWQATGEDVFLFSADANGRLTGRMHGFRFGAAETNVTFGRYVTSDQRELFVAQSAMSLADWNAGPKVGPVVLSEIHYQPPATLTEDDPAAQEYLEFRNITDQAVPLARLTSSNACWQLRGSVEFDFPDTFVLLPHACVLVVGFDPQLLPARVESFRATHAIPGHVPILGPYRGKLPDGGGSVRLLKPFAPVPATGGATSIAILVDEVGYGSRAPWPSMASGTGLSLQRVVESAFGDDPTNWVAVGRSPGYSFVPGPGPVITTQPASVAAMVTTPVTLSVEASGAPPLSYQWWFRPADGSNFVIQAGTHLPNFTIPVVSTADAGAYQCQVANASGAVLSQTAFITVLPPPDILEHPTRVGVKVPPDPQAASNRVAVFRLTAVTANPPLHYRWQRNGTNLPVDEPRHWGVTSNVLTITNVVREDAALYRCAVTDSIGTVYSSNALLQTWVSPILIQQPQSQTILQGDPVTLTVGVSNVSTGPFTYVWRQVSTIIASNHMVADYFNSITITNVPLQISNLNRYRCDVQSPATTGAGVVSTPAFVTVLADLDRDRLPDYWEVLHGLDPNNAADAGRDLDGDGMSNRDEYLAGTDPGDPESVLKVTRIEPGPGRWLEFTAVSNRTYSVEHAERPVGGAWWKLADVTAEVTNRVMRVEDPGPADRQRFYRLVTPRR